MAGRTKQKIYQYSSEGKFLQEYESQAELKKKYFGNSQYPLFQSNVRRGGITKPREYDILPDGTYIAKYRIGRDKLLRELKLDNNVYCKDLKADRTIEVFNILGEKVAEFKNMRVLMAMTKMDDATLQSRLRKHSKNLRVRMDNRDTLEYKYK